MEVMVNVSEKNQTGKSDRRGGCDRKASGTGRLRWMALENGDMDEVKDESWGNLGEESSR